MAEFQVSGPDGSVYHVNGPEGATEADAIAYVQSQLARQPQAPAVQTVTAAAPDTRTPDEKLEDEMIPQAVPPRNAQTPGPRIGDSLKAIFGSHNPVAETADIVGPAIADIAGGVAGTSGRPLLQRGADAINFAADTQLRAFSQGQLGLGDIGLPGAEKSAQDFGQNNPGIVNALDVAGGVAAGVGLGAPNLAPEGIGALPTPAPKVAKPLLTDAAAAAIRQGVDLPRAASSDSSIVNNFSAYAREVPFAGQPLATAIDKSVKDTGNRIQSIVDDLGSAQSPETSGSAVKDILSERLNSRVDELANNIGATADALGTATPLEAGEAARDFLTRELSSASDDIVNRANTIAGQYGGGSTVSAGESIADNISQWIKKNSNDAAQTVFADVEKQIDPQFKQPLDATRGVLAQLVANAREAHIDLPPVYHDVLDAVRNPQGLTYKGLETLRARIGTKLDDHLTPDVEKVPLKQVYGALSQDTQTLLMKAGGQNALGAWFHANKAFTELTRVRQALTKVVGLSGDAAPEAIVSRLENMASSTGTADMHRLIQAKQAAGPFAWSELASAIIKKNSDTPEALVRMYGKLSENGRKILFEGAGRPQFAQTLDAIVRDAEPGGRVDQLRQALEPIAGRTTLRSGEAVLDRLQRMAQSRGSDLVNLKYARRVMGERAWNDVSAAILRRMGERPNGFDPDAFRADLARLSPEGHAILFKDRAPMITKFAEEAAPGSALADYRNTIGKVLGSSHSASGETVVERLSSMARTKGGADIHTLLTIKHNIERESPEAWQGAVASILDRMGRTKEGFSLPQWRTEWAKLSENGKRALFSQEHIDALNDIDIYGKKLEHVMKGNTSKTAVWGMYAGMFSQLISAPLHLAAELAGVVSASWLLAKPARAKVTASWFRQALDTAREPTEINRARLQQLSSVLAALGQADPNGSRRLAQ